MPDIKRKLCWITPDYFLNVDARIVPLLTIDYQIDWILISTFNSQRSSDGLVSGNVKPRTYQLKYRQRDPRIIIQYLWLLSSIRKNGYDLVYSSFHGLPYFFPVLLLLINLNKFIYGVHNVHTPKGATHERLMRLYQNYAFAVAKRFHVFSRYQLRTIKTLQPGKRHYYAPLALEDYGPSIEKPPSNTIRFLFIGYIREYKRLDLLIMSFQELYNSGFTNIELVIAGRCDDWGYYETLIDRRLPIATKIGFVPNKDVADIVSSCHYVVLPYQDSAQSGVMSLAYYYNKPVITSDIEAFSEAVTDNFTGSVFRNLSQESLTAVMKNVVTRHGQYYEALKRNVAQYVTREYSIDRILFQYKHFINDTLTSSQLTK